eukprot:991086-Prymnesium_polylepis.2
MGTHGACNAQRRSRSHTSPSATHARSVAQAGADITMAPNAYDEQLNASQPHAERSTRSARVLRGPSGERCVRYTAIARPIHRTAPEMKTICAVETPATVAIRVSTDMTEKITPLSAT